MQPINIPTKKIKLSVEKGVPEKHIEKNNKDYCKYLKIMSEKFMSPSKRSVPDQLVTFQNGLVIFIEYKAPGKRPTVKQF